jgi:hypothetical protein
MDDNNTPKRRMLYGSKQIAAYLGDERLAWKIRRHCGEWPIFLWGNTLVAYSDALDAAIAEKQRAGLASLKEITRKHPSARNLELIT